MPTFYHNKAAFANMLSIGSTAIKEVRGYGRSEKIGDEYIPENLVIEFAYKDADLIAQIKRVLTQLKITPADESFHNSNERGFFDESYFGMGSHRIGFKGIKTVANIFVAAGRMEGKHVEQYYGGTDQIALLAKSVGSLLDILKNEDRVDNQAIENIQAQLSQLRKS